MKELAIELLNTIKFIPLRERQTKWYKEYLDKINYELQIELIKEK